MSNLIEAGDGLAEAIASGNTGGVQNALDAWNAAKEEFVTENGVDDVDAADVEQGDGEPGADPDAGVADAASGGAGEPVNPC